MKLNKYFKRLLSTSMIAAMITLAVSNGTPVQAAVKASDHLSATAKYLHLGREEANSYNFNIKNKEAGSTYAWSVLENKGNPNAVKINEKNGIVTANEAGIAYISVKITYTNGTIISPEAKVIVRNNISEVDISNMPELNAITVGKSKDFNRVILNTEAGKDKTPSGITRWELADDTAGADKVSSNGIVSPSKEGSFKIRAVSFQSIAKYNAWLSDKAANIDLVTAASKWYDLTVLPEATNPGLFELRVNDMPVGENDIVITDKELNQIDTLSFHLTEEAARAEVLVTTTLSNGTVVHEILADKTDVQYLSADISAMRAKFGQLPEGVYNFTLKITNNLDTQTEKVIVLTAKSQATIEVELTKAATEAISGLFVDANVPNTEKALAESVNQSLIDATTALVNKLSNDNNKIFGHAAIAIAQGLLDTKLANESEIEAVKAATEAISALFVDVKAPNAEKALAEGVNQTQIDEATVLVNELADANTKIFGHAAIAIAQGLLDTKLANEAEAATVEKAITALEELFVDANVPNAQKQLADGVDQAKIDETVALVNDAMAKAQELLDKKLAEAKKAPTLVSVTPEKDTTLTLNQDETFTLEVKANDENLRELEVDHNMTNLPEFSVYASEENPYGDLAAKENFESLGVNVTYNATTQTWTINFGRSVTDAIITKGNITFYLVLRDEDGNLWGSMDPTTEDNTFKYTVTK